MKGCNLPGAAILLALTLQAACAGTVATQAQVAHTTAQALNRAGPVWVRAMETEATDAVNDVCPVDTGRCEEAPMRAAADAVFARWAPVSAAWEGARLAHDTWRVQLERCRADSAARGCDAPALDQLALAMLSASQRWRCALRTPTIGRADLDPFPGSPACPLATDAGAPAHE